MLPILLLAQAAPAIPPRRIDLTAPVAGTACKADGSDDIVVCGGRDSPYRLRPLPERSGSPAIPKAETSLFGNVKGAIETEQGNVGGIPTNRLMFRLKAPF